MYSIKNTKFKSIIVAISTACLIVFVLSNSKLILDSVNSSILLCLTVIIPSLFCFMVISNFIMLTNLSIIMFKPFNFISKYILKLPSSLTYVFILSMIGGYPIGAKLISELVRSNKIDIITANRMLIFCVNSGPAFILGAVAIPIFNSTTIGILIFFSHIISALIIGFISSFKIKSINQNNYQLDFLSYSTGIINSVSLSIKTLANISGLVVLFSAIISILSKFGIIDKLTFLLQTFIPADISNVIAQGMLEITTGINSATSITPSMMLIVCITFITGFSGICIIFQSITMFSGIKIKKFQFILFRLIHATLSAIIVSFVIKFFNIAIPVYYVNQQITPKINSVSPYVTLSLIILSLLLLFSSNRYDIIQNKENK